MKGALVFTVASCFLIHSTFAADCIELTKCDGNDGCLFNPLCNWCYPEGGPSKLGYCTAKGKCGDGSQVGTLKTLLGNEFVLKSVSKTEPAGACPFEGDKDSPLVLDKKSCLDCVTGKANHVWCEIDIGTASGAVCLNKDKKATDCEKLRNNMGPMGATAFRKSSVCPQDTPCPLRTSCEECSQRCVWCGLTVKDKTAFVPGGGTQLGMCVGLAKTKGDDACAPVKTKTFGQMEKVLQYQLPPHEYKTEITEFALNGKGWVAGSCEARRVDPSAFTVGKCEDCITKQSKWCRVVNYDSKQKKVAAGGVCLGKDDAKAMAICDTLKKTGGKDFYEAESIIQQFECSAGVSVAAASSALVAAALASFVMFA